MFSLERAQGSRRVGMISLIGLILVPLVVAAGFLWATWNSDTRLDRVQAAIVNNDEGVTLNKQLVPLGRQLAGGLVKGEEGVENFDWVLTDDADATSGIESGRYAAVVTIPKDFSKQATSFSKDKTSDIAPATIDVQTSQIRGIADGVVAQFITGAATNALNTELTKQYLDKVYIGFNDTGKQFTTVADAAGKLSDGATQLSDGLNQTSDGTSQLADGLGQLSTGAARLSSGVTQYTDGVSQLSSGLNKLSDGTKELPDQVRQLADGTQKSADGADELAKGMKQYAAGVHRFNVGTGEQPGIGAFAKGVAGYTQLGAGVDQGLTQFDEAMQSTSKSYAELAQPGVPLESLKAGLGAVGITCQTDMTDEQCAGFLSAAAAGVAAGTGAAHAGLTTKSDVGGGQQMSLLDLSGQLSSNGPPLAAGAKGIAGGVGKLDTGASKLSSGTGQLAIGLGKLADGTDKLADGMKPLADGITSAAAGASKLAAGGPQLASGTSQLADGASASASGTQQLSIGVAKLADGGSQLADGSGKLADGLGKGAKAVPSYDKDKRVALSTTVATPVSQERPDALFADIANTTFLAVIALWLGGLASFLILRAVPRRVLTSMKPSWRLAGEALLPAAGIGVVQAVALTVALQMLLDLTARQVGQMLPLLMLAALAFVAINHALVGWLGGVGRFVSVGVVVLVAAAAITDAVPPALSAIVPFLPLTPALEGARAIASGGTGALGAGGLLFIWLVAGVAAGVLAISRRRLAPAPATAWAGG